MYLPLLGLAVPNGTEDTMGFLGGLFGRSSDRDVGTKDRCMECGMTGGGHTDWCSNATVEAPRPSAEAVEAVEIPPAAVPTHHSSRMSPLNGE